MNVKPDELANVCAIFAVLRTGNIAQHQLESYVAKSLLLDSTANPRQIIAECISCMLLKKEEKEFVLSDLGRQLARKQQAVGNRMTESAREMLLKDVYLNPEAMSLSCRAFLLGFHADAVQGTFVCDRVLDDTSQSIWLRIFYRVGLIDLSFERVSIRSEYLGLFSVVLARIRGVVIATGTDSIAKDDIGNFAEERAVEYEIKRLRENGYPDLALLVQRISVVDQYAGYDVISRKGTGRRPEQLRFIEVKGTARASVRFIWSRNERSVAEREGVNYWIYAYTNVDVQKRASLGPVRIYDPTRRLKKLGYISEPLDVLVLFPTDRQQESQQ